MKNPADHFIARAVFSFQRLNLEPGEAWRKFTPDDFFTILICKELRDRFAGVNNMVYALSILK